MLGANGEGWQHRGQLRHGQHPITWGCRIHERAVIGTRVLRDWIWD